MKEKTLEEVLENVKKQVQSLMMSTPYELSKETEIINQAAQEIKELIKAKLPKEKNGMDDQQANFLYGNNIAVFIAGHSEALSDVVKIVEEL